MIQRIKKFLEDDIWRVKLKKLPRSKSLLIRTVRLVVLSFKEFGKDQCYFRASALTFYTLLSIVPVFAMAFGIAKGFGLEVLLQQKIVESLQGQEAAVSRIIEFSRVLLENTKGGVVAGIGIAVLFWTIIKVLGNIEESFNKIWGVTELRPMSRRFSDYLSLMLICPILIILSSSLTVFVANQVTAVTQKIVLFGFLSPLIYKILSLLPYCVLWFLLTFIYIFIPNTKVRLSSAILGGIVGGTLYQVVQWIYVYFQIGVSSYGAIYGSFAALPLFLVWLQMSWAIILFGAEVAFAHQNEETYEFEADCLKVSDSFKKLLSIRIVQLVIKRFTEGEVGWSAIELGHHLDAPIRLVRLLLHELTRTGILLELKGKDEKDTRYQPGRPIESLTIKSVMDAMDNYGLTELSYLETPELKEIREHLADFQIQITKSPANILIKNL